MPNTSGLTGKIQITPWTTDRKLELGCETVSLTTTYYDGQAVGRDANGNMVQMDDTAKCEFIGILQSVVDNQIVNTTDVVGQTIFRVLQPLMFIANTSFTATAGMEGQKVYFQYNETLSLTGLTNWNLAGYIWQVISTSQVVVIPPWLSRVFGGSRVALQTGSATGTMTTTKYDVNRDYLMPITGNVTVTLALSTTCSPGDDIGFIKSTSNADSITFVVQGADSINASTPSTGSVTTQWHKNVVETDGSGNWYYLG